MSVQTSPKVKRKLPCQPLAVTLLYKENLLYFCLNIRTDINTQEPQYLRLYTIVTYPNMPTKRHVSKLMQSFEGDRSST
jgi:hypothetical protein